MPSLTPGDAHDLLASFKRGWESRDPDAVLSLFDEHAEYREDPFAAPLSGSNAIRARWNEIAAEQTNVEFDAERTWVSGSTVLASWHGAHTRRRTSERVRQRGFLTMELGEDRLVTRLRQWAIERVVGVDTTARPQGEDI